MTRSGVLTRSLIYPVSLAVLLAYVSAWGFPSAVSGAAAQSTIVYSLNDVISLLEKRGTPLYLSVPGSQPKDDKLARVIYIPDEQKRLQLDIVAGVSLNGRTPHEIPPTEPIVKQRMTGTFDAELVIVVCGMTFGDDDQCDQYSPINAKPLFGKQINAEARRLFTGYLQAIGEVLNKKP